MWTGWRRPLSYRQLWTSLKLNSGVNNFIRFSQTRRIQISSRQFGEERERPVQSIDDEGKGVTQTTSASDNLSNDQLAQLVASLSPEERIVILDQIHHIHAEEAKKKAEEKLASWRWRSRFGRPTSLHTQFGADPTGTYCEIPAEWLRKKAAERNKPKKPTIAELRKLAVHNALPFVGFGLLDNVIMIVAGDYIDLTIGTMLGISTMAAAALGNTISDLAGIGSAWYVENIAVKIGIRAPELTQEQLGLMSCRWIANMGRGLGVVLGCLLGMFPLLFLPNHAEDKKTRPSESSSSSQNQASPATST
ncbi:hypothetical protein Pcinc_032238 [Petrolisthes cinctipes]|uniref:Transmembrane protein 65 n=1 Tax=Petrolisthes cinctipes TaxID=88211 RepID=A0AAE1EUR1_PETCI|nr:hypothetical protein Pcinc_032238 [Petrolisthes cinctipes]